MCNMIKVNLAERLEDLNYTEADAIRALKTELERGIESMEQGQLYTIEEAWKEIDAVQSLWKNERIIRYV